ncbi:MAG: orotidine-5'-phosphate decarboxylase, partial [Bacteroidales bacterium]|nr:orotidine-5'-phosphate decarboxylase [Bacteroidales bacterium]
FQQIKQKRSFLCIGLDTEMEKLPKHLLSEKDPVFSFNKAIIDATAQYAVAYKPNTAFYEVHGSKGWESLEKTIKYLKINYPEIFVIADAKRGDIGNTSVNYARAFFNHLDSDALTVAPYMGFDSVSPFLGFDDKWVILLALTSNSGSTDFQYNHQNSGKRLFEEVLTKAKTWANSEQMMFVVGATHPEEIAAIRQLVPDYFLLVPGVGAQGGSLEAVAENGLNDECGLLVNSSRGILYASSHIDFAEKAAEEAQKLQLQMEKVLLKKALI